MKKTTSILAAAFAVSSISASGAIVIAGIDTWDSATAPTVPVTIANLTATATASATGGSWAPGEGSSRGASKDTTWGTFGGPAAATAVTTGTDQSFTLTNGKTDGEITITLTNTGSGSIDLETFHLDAVAFRPNAARTYALNVLAGSDITVGNVFTSAAPFNDNSTDAITHLAGGLLTDDLDPLTHDQHDDIDLDLTGLADYTLAAGEVAIIQIAFSNGTGAGGGHHLFVDNVGISGTVIPEPSSAALLGLGALGLLVRRRR